MLLPPTSVAVRRLAALDSAFPPTGDVLLAEMGDELWAALSVDTGHAVADPFRPSGDLVELLRFRAERIAAETATRGACSRACCRARPSGRAPGAQVVALLLA